MVLLFHTTQSALLAEEVLLENGLGVDVVPRPEGAPGGLCGLALDVPPEELAEADYLLTEADIAYRLFDGSAPPGPSPDEAPTASRDRLLGPPDRDGAEDVGADLP